MNFVSFIPCRLGEPITAIDISEGNIAFGSIIGYYGVYNIDNDELHYGKECLSELVRAVKLFKRKLYLTNGDENIAVASLDSLDQLVLHDYPELRYKHEVCSNYLSFFSVEKEQNLLASILVFAPTTEVNRQILERPNDVKICTYLTRFAESGQVEQQEITEKIKLKNYSVIMDFSDTRLLYLFRRVPSPLTVDDEPGPFVVCVHDFEKNDVTKLVDLPESIKLLRFFGTGFVFVLNNKSLAFYDIFLRKTETLFKNDITIVTLAVDQQSGRVAFIDKASNISVYDQKQNMMSISQVPLKSIATLPPDLKNYNNFEMEYPYFAALDGKLFAFTTDFGIYAVKLEN